MWEVVFIAAQIIVSLNWHHTEAIYGGRHGCDWY